MSQVLSRRSLVSGLTAGTATAIAARLLPANAAAPASARSGPKLRRGGSIHTLMNWADLKPGSKDQFVWPPFSRPHFDIPATFLRQLAATGIDFVRMTVDQGPWLQAGTSQRKQLDGILQNKCQRILDAGLDVIVDIHPVNQVDTYNPVRITSDINSQLFKNYTAMTGHVAGVLAQFDPAHVAFEPFNEPPWGYNDRTIRRWQSMMEIMHAAIRANNSKINVIWSGAKSGDLTALLAVDTKRFGDTNIIWTFHYYAPHIFTHQGVETSQENLLYYRYLSDLPYPPSAGNTALVQQTIAQNIMVDTQFSPPQRKTMQLQAMKAAADYITENATTSTIDKDFERVAQWANQNNIPNSKILLGEFGVVRRSDTGNGPQATHRYAWLRAVRQAAEHHGFGWALWDC